MLTLIVQLFRNINTCFSFSHDHIEIIVASSGELLFFRHREGPWVPTLKLLHKCKLQSTKPVCNKVINKPNAYSSSDPFCLPWQQVDKGAIRFVLSGANIMCPGLTSPGAKMTPSEKGTVVVSSQTLLCFCCILLYVGYRKYYIFVCSWKMVKSQFF
jgi:predicted ribosome-associated RNA-binding protein Tma20